MDTYILTKRRNLLLTSILLFLISFAGVDIQKDLSMTSLKLHIEDPIMIYMILWGLYFYFLIRFIQVLLDSDDEGASDARGLLSLLNPPWYLLKMDDHAIYTFGRLGRLIEFSVTTIFSFIMLIARSILEKDFFEYIFPILFAIIIGFLSYNSTFMEAKKIDFDKRIYNYTCKMKHQLHDIFIPEKLQNYELFDFNYSTKDNLSL